ncbi:hypothetical protein VIBNISFn118_2350006 [Vibrio nigripulchritudo SFn118]|nr:hypothetical protein VIBNISFn118_2350006 [Vibrio nigripulchritudo SFn118]
MLTRSSITPADLNLSKSSSAIDVFMLSNKLQYSSVLLYTPKTMPTNAEVPLSLSNLHLYDLIKSW